MTLASVRLLAPVLLLVAPVLAAQQSSVDAKVAPPDSATIALGQQLYQGRGLCMGCHGERGEGMLGPTTELGAGKVKWLHHDGSLAGIVAVITAGVDAEHSVSGQVMPPRGGSRLTEPQIRAVAAYVQRLHQSKAVEPKRVETP